MGQRGLGNVQDLGCAPQPTGLLDCMDGAQVAKLKINHAVMLMFILNIMNLFHKWQSDTMAITGDRHDPIETDRQF